MKRNPPKPLTPEKLIKRLLKKREAIKRQILKARAKRLAEKKPRKPMKKVSKEKAAWNRKYSKALKERKEAQIAERGTTYCEHCGQNGPVDGHHYRGRVGEAIMDFCLVQRRCHESFHNNPNKARQEGWLK